MVLINAVLDCASPIQYAQLQVITGAGGSPTIVIHNVSNPVLVWSGLVTTGGSGPQPPTVTVSVQNTTAVLCNVYFSDLEWVQF